MFCSPKISLLPLRSGMRSVSPSIATNPGSSPFGETSGFPSAPTVARSTRGERWMKAIAVSSSESKIFDRTTGTSSPTMDRIASTLVRRWGSRWLMASDLRGRRSASRVGRAHDADVVAIGILDDRIAGAPEGVVRRLRRAVAEAVQPAVDPIHLLARRHLEAQHVPGARPRRLPPAAIIHLRQG